VKVIVRVRPFLEMDKPLKEKIRQVTATSGLMALEKEKNRIKLNMDARNKDNKHFQFDLLADGGTNQKDFYEQAGISYLVKKVVKGYHSTVFAYGQTGSGKTYTMEGYEYVKNEKGKYIPQY